MLRRLQLTPLAPHLKRVGQPVRAPMYFERKRLLHSQHQQQFKNSTPLLNRHEAVVVMGLVGAAAGMAYKNHQRSESKQAYETDEKISGKAGA